MGDLGTYVRGWLVCIGAVGWMSASKGDCILLESGLQ